MAHFNNFGCYLIEVNLDDQSLFRLVLALATGISASLGLLVTFRQHELHLLMHFVAFALCNIQFNWVTTGVVIIFALLYNVYVQWKKRSFRFKCGSEVIFTSVIRV